MRDGTGRGKRIWTSFGLTRRRRKAGSEFRRALAVLVPALTLSCSSGTTDPASGPDDGSSDANPWSYVQPPVTGDGWETGTLAEAGIELAPGRVNPIASAIAVIVEAVPMVMQCP